MRYFSSKNVSGKLSSSINLRICLSMYGLCPIKSDLHYQLRLLRGRVFDKIYVMSKNYTTNVWNFLINTIFYSYNLNALRVTSTILLGTNIIN